MPADRAMTCCKRQHAATALLYFLPCRQSRQRPPATTAACRTPDPLRLIRMVLTGSSAKVLMARGVLGGAALLSVHRFCWVLGRSFL